MIDPFCVVALAETFRGDRDIVASAMGDVPTLAARLAQATFAPDLLITDGVATIVDAQGNTEGWLPFRRIFDVVWSGRRHVAMGASQIDQYGNQNISCIGDWSQPKAQLLGARGAPGNTINHPTSYWIPNHTPNVFVEQVDFVSGLGYDRARVLGEGGRFHEIRLVVSNLGSFDFATPDRRMRLRARHPNVSVDEIAEQTDFELVIPAGTPVMRDPSTAEQAFIDGWLADRDARSGMQGVS